jgi:N utilization substance protein A
VNKEFSAAISQVCHDRQLPKEVVLEAVEAALVSAYRRKVGSIPGISARIDPETGEASIFTDKEVVESVTDDSNQMTLEDAHSHQADANIGDVVPVDTTPDDFGRIAAQTARQVILQRIREAERDSLFHIYAERADELINGTVQSIDQQQVTLSLGKVEAILPRQEQMPTERYTINQRLRAYVSEVQRTPRGPLIIVSRTHRNMLRRLLELEVPEIFSGTVEIKAIAREAGYRSKIAVGALQEGVDPVGSCVGMRGVRIQSIVNELNGEKIDVVAWSPDPATLIANSLSPAKVLNVVLVEDSGDKTAIVIVPDRQLSLAIGKEGQNARLAAKLTSWRIDIKSITEATTEALEAVAEQEDLKEATSKDQDILTIASEILNEKEGPMLSDGEVLALSQAVQIVKEARMSLEKERAAARLRATVAEALETTDLTESQAVDEESAAGLLTRAEAILAGTETEEPAEPEEAVAGQEPAEISVEAAIETEAIVEQEAEAAVSEGAVEAEEVQEEEEETISLEPVPAPADIGLRWAAEVAQGERGTEEGPEKKGAQRRQKRHLVYDEELGEVVQQHRHKSGRTRDEWDEDL